MNIDEAIERYIFWKHNKRKRAAENNKLYLEKFSKWLKEKTKKTEIEDIDDVDAGQFQQYLICKNYAESTISITILAVRDLVKYFYLKGVTKFNYQLIQVPESIARFHRHAIKYNSLTQILSVIGGNLIQQLRDKLILNMLYTSGLRVSELVGMNAKDIRPDVQGLSIPNKKHPNGCRVIAWDDETHRLLMLWLEKREIIARDDSLFISFKGRNIFRRITTRSVQRLVKKYSLKAGIEKADVTTPHCFRHAFCQTLKLCGFEIGERARRMGHLNIGSTQQYEQWRDDELIAQNKEKYIRNIEQVKSEDKELSTVEPVKPLTRVSLYDKINV